MCITVILLLFESKKQLPLDKRNPNFVYGTPQAIIAVTLLVLCFIRTLNNNKLQQMSVNESRMTSVK